MYEVSKDHLTSLYLYFFTFIKARLQTFSSWTFFTDPQDLAEAGFFCMGWSDLVQCFCCGGQLSGSDLKDDAWEEHSRRFPHCSFILGYNVENVPLQMDEDEEGHPENGCPPCMKTLKGRLSSFDEFSKSYL
uniref:RING-type E3 ubiquitin transferase n=1 Tax=Oryzias sinensis TaxID=183150 RepID=A0A8C7XME2_9TELE